MQKINTLLSFDDTWKNPSSSSTSSSSGLQSALNPLSLHWGSSHSQAQRTDDAVYKLPALHFYLPVSPHLNSRRFNCTVKRPEMTLL